jgi:glutathione peroxidase
MMKSAFLKQRAFLQALIIPAVIAAFCVPSNESIRCQAADANDTVKKDQAKSIYKFEAKTLEGKEIKFNRYKNKVLLIVNTASQCKYTPQYAALEDLNKKYSKRGLDILGFPCNQFGSQEPGSSEQIASFCQKNYGVDFQMFDKVDVNGSDAIPLYRWFTSMAPDPTNGEAIKWNFTKFLIDKKGNIVHRYEPSVKPEDISADIEKAVASN